MQGLRPLMATQTYPHLLSGWAALGTPGPPLSSKNSGGLSLVVLRGLCQDLSGWAAEQGPMVSRSSSERGQAERPRLVRWVGEGLCRVRDSSG